MNVVNKFLLATDKLMFEMHLSRLGFTCICELLTKSDKVILKFEETGDSRYIYQNEAYFQHEMAYGDFKDLTSRTASDKRFRDKAFNIAKNIKYDGHQRGLPSMVYNFFDK